MISEHIFCVKKLNKIKRSVELHENHNESTLSGFCFDIRRYITHVNELYESGLSSNCSKKSEKDINSLFVYYWYCYELYLLYNEFPFDKDAQITYLIDKLAHYKKYCRIDPIQYQCYCANKFKVEVRDILVHSHHFENGDIAFLDPNYPSFTPLYFETSEKLIQFITTFIQHLKENRNENYFQWTGNITDLAVIVYSLVASGTVKCASGKKASPKKFAKVLSGLFNLDIGENFFQVMNGFKNRKNLKDNILTNLLTMFDE